MAVPRFLARFNRAVMNRPMRPLARYLPGLGVVVHSGRKTHRQYRTPVLVFPQADGYVVALVYGSHSDWVRNVLASGGCTLETRGRTLRLTRARLFHDEQRRALPALIRLVLGLIRVADFLVLTLV